MFVPKASGLFLAKFKDVNPDVMRKGVLPSTLRKQMNLTEVDHVLLNI